MPRVLVEDLDGAGAELVPRSTAIAGPPPGETWAPISMLRGGSSMLLPDARPLRPRRPPARSTSAAPAPRSTTGCSRAAGGDARAADRGHRPRALHPGERRADLRGARWLGSTATRARSSSPGAPARHARGRSSSCSPAASPTGPPPAADDVRAYKEPTAPTAASGARPRARARSACACPTRALPWSTTSIRGDTTFERAHHDDLVIARADSTPALPPRGRGRRPRRRHHPRRPRRGPPLQHAEAPPDLPGDGRRAPGSRTSRYCTGPTARSSPSATARPRSRSSAPAATCRRRSATTSRSSAGATTDDETFFTTDELAGAFDLARVSK